MKLGTRLVIGFAIVSLATVGIGITGIVAIKDINDADRFLYANATEPMIQLVSMTENFQSQRIGLRDAIDAANAEEESSRLAAAHAKGESVEKAASELSKTLITTEGRKIFSDFEAARKGYDTVFDEIISADKRGDKTTVTVLMKGKGPAAADAEQAAIDSLVQAKVKYAASVAEDNGVRGEYFSLFMLFDLLVVVLIGVFTALAITRRITKSVGGEPAEIARVADQVARGDLSMDFGDAANYSGIQRSLAGMVASLKAKSEALKKIANGDLSANIELASEGDELGLSLRTMLSSLNELLSQVSSAVEQVAVGSNQVSSAAQTLSQGAAEQAASIEEISASLTEIAGQTAQNSDNAREMNGLAKSSHQEAEGGNERMKELVSAMADINRSSEDVKKIVKAIDDIAFQINLLALNANVEAARAGKYGKGFAVVADEVRSLAVRSAEAVKETTRMVEDSIAKMERGNELVKLTATQLVGIAEGSARVAAIAEDVASASEEQTRGVEQISAGIEQIDQVTQSNSSSAEESAAAAEELAAQSQQLKSMIERFKLRSEEAAPSALASLSPQLLSQLLEELRAGGWNTAQPEDKATAIKSIAHGGATTGDATGTRASTARTKASDSDYSEF
jgi:methyl-accepting chemotaxis protein